MRMRNSKRIGRHSITTHRCSITAHSYNVYRIHSYNIHNLT